MYCKPWRKSIFPRSTSAQYSYSVLKINRDARHLETALRRHFCIRPLKKKAMQHPPASVPRTTTRKKNTLHKSTWRTIIFLLLLSTLLHPPFPPVTVPWRATTPLKISSTTPASRYLFNQLPSRAPSPLPPLWLFPPCWCFWCLCCLRRKTDTSHPSERQGRASTKAFPTPACFTTEMRGAQQEGGAGRKKRISYSNVKHSSETRRT